MLLSLNRRVEKKYFREYVRKNKAKLKIISLMGGVSKMMSENKILSESIIDKTELMRRRQNKIDFNINKIKIFLNI